MRCMYVCMYMHVCMYVRICCVVATKYCCPWLCVIDKSSYIVAGTSVVFVHIFVVCSLYVYVV